MFVLLVITQYAFNVKTLVKKKKLCLKKLPDLLDIEYTGKTCIIFLEFTCHYIIFLLEEFNFCPK